MFQYTFGQKLANSWQANRPYPLNGNSRFTFLKRELRLKRLTLTTEIHHHLWVFYASFCVFVCPCVLNDTTGNEGLIRWNPQRSGEGTASINKSCKVLCLSITLHADWLLGVWCRGARITCRLFFNNPFRCRGAARISRSTVIFHGFPGSVLGENHVYRRLGGPKAISLNNFYWHL